MTRSQQILDSFWNYSEKLGELDRSSENYALFISSVNDLVDNFNHRITMTLEYRIPIAILWVLFVIAFLSMLALGYQFGFLILSLDRPETGIAKLNQKPMFTLQHQLHQMQLNTEK
jgi:hypothetical protein